MQRKVRIGREIQREDFPRNRIFVIGLDGQCPIVVCDGVDDVSLPGVAGPQQRDRDLGGRILLERLHAGRDRRREITRKNSDLRLAPPGGFQHGIDGERRIKLGFRPAELPHLKVEPAAVGQNLGHVWPDGEGRVERGFAPRRNAGG